MLRRTNLTPAYDLGSARNVRGGGWRQGGRPQSKTTSVGRLRNLSVLQKGLTQSRDLKQVIFRSRFVGDIHASTYERAFSIHAHARPLDLGSGQVPLYGVYREQEPFALIVQIHFIPVNISA